MAHMRRVATHYGTGTDIVRDALQDYGIELVVVDNRRDAHRTQFDGLMLLGGADISPMWYGETNRHCGSRDADRDLIEWTLARRALSEHAPIFGICRGCQMLAVVTGGSLYQDISIDAGKTRHGDGYHKLVNVHQPFARVLPALEVNSLHHQAVKTIPPGLQTVAMSPDGVIEAIWRPGLLGVQFHPELMLPNASKWIRLFRWFVDGLR